MKISKLFMGALIASTLLFNGCSEDGSIESEDTISSSDFHTPSVSSEYSDWEDAGSPEIENIPLPYLPREIDSSSTSNAVARNRAVSRTGATSFPTKFDLRDVNSDGSTADSVITDVGNQGQCGVCWAFAAMGALEGGYGTSINLDFSENNLKHEHGFTTGSNSCAGGLSFMPGAYFARGDGVLNETQEPYYASSSSSYTCPTCEPSRYVDNTYWYSGRSGSVVNKNLIKDLLVNSLKPVQVSVEVSSGTAGEYGTSNYDSATSSFYQSGYARPNHSVVIVGYDDSYVAQGQTGAFIIKNSWGTSHGDEGYIYVPYTDKSIGSGLIAVYEDLSDDEYSFDNMYAHDGKGMIGAYYSLGVTKAYGANIYTSTKVEDVVGINVMNYDDGASYKFEIHKMTSTAVPSWGNTSTRVGDRIDPGQTYPMGYHTIPLDTELSLGTATRFAVLIEFTAPSGYGVQIPVETYHYYARYHSASAGQSYVSYYGTGYWYDTGAYANANLFVKVMTKDYVEPVNEAPVANAGVDQSVVEGDTVTFDASSSSDDESIVSYVWSQNNTLLSTSMSFTKSDLNVSTHTITLTVRDEEGLSSTDEVNITVSEAVTANVAPIATAQTITTSANTSVAIVLSGTDANDDTLTYLVAVDPSHGELTGTLPNLTYVPTTDYVGSDSFSFKAYDGTLYSTSVTVSITVGN